MKKIFLFLSIIVLIAASCKNHLSRESAKEQIISAEGYPKIKNYDFPKEFTKDYKSVGFKAVAIIGEKEFDVKEKAISNFKTVGLLNLDEEPHEVVTQASWPFSGDNVETWTSVKVSITEEGRKYLIKEDEKSYTVKLWETGIDNISGIKEMDGGKMTQAEYSISNRNLTPFGNYFNDKNAVTQKTSYFSKYDDVWRLTRN